MIKVTMGNNVKRTSEILDENTTLREALEDAGIDYTTGIMNLDRAVMKFGLDRGTITNYLRVSKLSPKLLTRLDNGEFKIAPAVEISYMNAEEQAYLNAVLDNQAYKLNTVIAAELRSASKETSLSKAAIKAIFERNKADANKKFASFKLSQNLLEQYFKPDQKPQEIEDEIGEALEYYRKNTFEAYKRKSKRT